MDFSGLIGHQQEYFAAGRTRDVGFRADALRKLAAALQAHEGALLVALKEDLGKPEHEAYAAEIGFVLGEIAYALRHLKRWARPQKRRTPRMAWPGRSAVVAEPRGAALIIGPWNYPVQLLLTPLVGAVAAGCCAVLKAPELTPATSRVIETVIAEAFDPAHVAVVQGDASTAKELLTHRFDQIFFTGGETVGREVMAAAARHLTPVVLELGGKSPCIVCADASLAVAARRIVWGKMMNAGQTCAAPDYVLVDSSKHNELIAELKTAIEQFYGADASASPDFGRIVSKRHVERLSAYLNDGQVVVGGGVDVERRFVAPTVLTGVSPDSPVMREEIFGPILPVIAVDGFAAAMKFVADRPTPLCGYVFTADRQVADRAARELRCGSVCINDVVLQLFGRDLPFGGLGPSGMGAYHGKATFDVFTHYKPVVRRGTAMDLRFRYPPAKLPLGKFKKVVRFLLRK